MVYQLWWYPPNSVHMTLNWHPPNYTAVSGLLKSRVDIFPDVLVKTGWEILDAVQQWPPSNGLPVHREGSRLGHPIGCLIS